MNPAEYAGRSSLSPAWRDRWLGHAQIQAPSEKDHADLLMFLITGNSPNVTVGGQTFFGERRNPPLPKLGELFQRKPDVGELAHMIARFHTSIESTAKTESHVVGKGRKESYIFTRRSLLAVMHAIERHLESPQPDRIAGAVCFALKRYYLDRLANKRDRNIANKLLEAVGLTPEAFIPKPVTEISLADKPHKPTRPTISSTLFFPVIPKPWARGGLPSRLPSGMRPSFVGPGHHERVTRVEDDDDMEIWES